MRLRRSLVLVAHDDPGVRVARAADLTRAGYRCLTAGDSEAALWFAVKLSFEVVPGLYPGIVLVSPHSLSAGQLPPTVSWVDSSLDDALIEAVGRVSWTQSAQLARIRVLHSSDRTPGLAMGMPWADTAGSACS
jgi:hypothetical protein